jgi:integrase
MKFSKVTVRKKKLSKGLVSLYLDFYPAITHPETGQETRREFLKLHFKDRPRNEEETRDKARCILLADEIRIMRETQIRDGQAGLTAAKSNESFNAYFRHFITRQTGSTAKGYIQTLRHFTEFKGAEITFLVVTATLYDDFHHYLKTAARIRTGGRKGGLSHNTIVSYLTKFLTVCSKAFIDGYMSFDVSKKVKRVKQEPTQREFLQLEELKQLANTACDPPYLRRAALFSALTGLRFSDIEKMKWGEIQKSPAGYFIQYRVQKTRSIEVLPIGEKALLLLGEPGDPERRVFPELSYSFWLNAKLREWVAASGIQKRLTFHAFRHTYATLQLAEGTDIYTISKMLGHRDIATTEIYAKLLDEKKRKSVDKIDIDI